jgi:hypothetical protein
VGPDGSGGGAAAAPLYSAGPTEDRGRGAGEEPASEGSFRFVVPRAGVVRIALTNPSESDARTVSFAWLMGRDRDDPYTARGGAREGGGGGGFGGGGDGGDGGDDNATAYMVQMLRRVSTLHKDIDDVTAVQQFADVRFARHLNTVESNKRRLFGWTLAETVVVVLSAVLQVLVVRSFDYARPPVPKFAGAGSVVGQRRHATSIV